MVIISKETKVLVQGMTGHQGAFHSGEMIKFGTNVVAGVSPGKAGTKVNGVDVYNNVADTLDLKPDASMISVPAFPGETPATTFVPNFIISPEWNAP